jgi:hypothetical protein
MTRHEPEWDSTQPLFKYLPRRYATALAQGQSIKVGTLKDFRDVEHHGAGRGDAGEGVRAIRGTYSGPPNEFTAAAVGVGPGSRNVVFRNTFISSSFQMNAFVFCMSSVCSRATMELFDDTDTCVQIDDAKAFLKEIERVLRVSEKIPISDRLMRTVLYGGARAFELRDVPEVSAAFVKPSRFRPQHEVRMVWVSKDPIKKKYVLLRRVQVAKYCRIVPVPA